MIDGPGEITSPRSLTPVFYGCFDWHSAVHGHWLLARAMKSMPESEFAQACHDALQKSLTSDGLLRESTYVAQRPSFERPYGLAWVLALAVELEGTPWREAIRPLEAVAVEHLLAWLPKLTFPVRSGTHNQTAFAMVLALDYARAVGNAELADLLVERAVAFHGSDRDFAVHLEPSGEDFFSPSLSAAWLMSRVLDQGKFTAWLESAMPSVGRGFSFTPVVPSDRSDGRLAHLDGLNLSRAWMLGDIAKALPEGDERRSEFFDSAALHRTAGLEGVSSTYYAGSHWLGTFAAYLDEGV